MPSLVAPQDPVAPLDPLRGPTSGTGTEASRNLLGSTAPPRPITLWGSSSMSSAGGAHATPLPVMIHEHVALAASPTAVHAFGVSATLSAHALLLRGLYDPQMTPGAAIGGGAIAVTVDPALPALGQVRCPGHLGGVPGVLDGTSGSWKFFADDAGAAVGPGAFHSGLSEVAAAARQVLWLGKNNILDVDTVLEHTQRMWDSTSDPAQDSLVLGHWPTRNDPVGSDTGEALRRVNGEYANRYGAHYVDLHALLSSEEGLTAPPIAHLRAMEQGSTHEALDSGVTPPILVAGDRIHLNGWGNLLVSWAIIRRMRELRWL